MSFCDNCGDFMVYNCGSCGWNASEPKVKVVAHNEWKGVRRAAFLLRAVRRNGYAQTGGFDQEIGLCYLCRVRHWNANGTEIALCPNY